MKSQLDLRQWLLLAMVWCPIWGLILLGVNNGHRNRTYSVTGTDDDWWIPVSGNIIKVELEPDVASTGTGTEVSVYTCTRRATAACSEYYWDSDDDGARDTYVLKGGSWPLQERRVRISTAASFILLDTTAYSDDGELAIYEE